MAASNPDGMRARRGSGGGEQERQARRRQTLARLATAAAVDPVVVDVHITGGPTAAATITLRGGTTIRALGVHAPSARRIPAGARLVDAHHPGPCYGLYFADRGVLRPLLAAELRVDHDNRGGTATPPPAGGAPAAAATAARTPAPTR